jgi:Mrp family chromosome partitioning ATPase
VAVSPQVPIVVGLAALAGLLGALLLVALVELTTGAIRTRAELGSTVGLDTLGEVARPRGARFRRGGATPAPLTVGADYGEAAARLMIAREQPPRVVVVVGTTVEDASDVAAAKLAVALAGVGHAVTLVDANDVVPTVTRLFEREVASRGSGDVMTPWSPIDTIVRINDHLQLVPAGVAPVDPTFQVDRFVQALLERASVVVVATAPLAESVRAVQWLRVADVVVLGVRRYRTRRDAASEAAETLALGTDGPLVTLLHEEEPVTRSPRAAPSPGEGEPRRDVRAPQAVERIRRRRPSSAPRDSG